MRRDRIRASLLTMYSKLQSGRLLTTAKVVLAALVLSSLLLASFPISTSAAGPLCKLACCSGRAPHAAGSCMNGSCHSGLNLSSHSHQDRHKGGTPVPPHKLTASEPMCGVTQAAKSSTSKWARVTTRARKSYSRDRAPDDRESLSSSVFTKPCQRDCGSCASGTLNSSRSRSAIARVNGIGPRPPLSSQLTDVDSNSIRSLSGLYRQHVPRGPPSFSEIKTR